MRFGWETKEERILRAVKISPEKKLEGLRLMNESADRVLSKKQKIHRRKIREKSQGRGSLAEKKRYKN